ncbi:MAG: hypothetical protein V7733_07560 [Paraglaciecola polaris]|uniref:hypothetical protein n=1 Tax=Paraglaciecola polaris TaxID=222814 RepID=UPI0030036751
MTYFQTLVQRARVTSFQQLKEVIKKSRPPASLYFLCVSTNTGRENAFPTRLSLRLHPRNLPRVNLRCSEFLESGKDKGSDFVAKAWLCLSMVVDHTRSILAGELSQGMLLDMTRNLLLVQRCQKLNYQTGVKLGDSDNRALSVIWAILQAAEILLLCCCRLLGLIPVFI